MALRDGFGIKAEISEKIRNRVQAHGPGVRVKNFFFCQITIFFFTVLAQ
jgi:hypothetical protein